MYHMRYLVLILLALYAIQAKAQFHTIKPLPRETFRIVNNPPQKPKEVQSSIDSIQVTSAQGDSLGRQGQNPLEGFSLPLDSPIVINSRYGYRTDPFTGKQRFHNGVDLRSRASTVLSVLGGKVKKTGYERKGLGNYVTMKYGDFELTYGHLSSIFVSQKDVVKPGTPLGISGSTGRSTGDHLHLSLKVNGKRVDPLPFLLFIQKRADNAL